MRNIEESPCLVQVMRIIKSFHMSWCLAEGSGYEFFIKGFGESEMMSEVEHPKECARAAKHRNSSPPLFLSLYFNRAHELA